MGMRPRKGLTMVSSWNEITAEIPAVEPDEEVGWIDYLGAALALAGSVGVVVLVVVGILTKLGVV